MTGKKKILVIEDDLAIAELQKDYLDVNDFDAVICSDGLKALEQVRTLSYDLILLDLMLPGLSGLDLLRQVRGITDVPILIVSAKREDIDKIKGLGLGADDYITKPFSPGELVARVKAHLSKMERLKNRYTDRDQAKTLVVRGLEVQPDSRRVLLNSQAVNLAHKEFDLLLFLMSSPNRVFSKDELFEKIWGLDALGDTATVTVHIARIREKIETGPSDEQYIETVWGAGYRFRA